MLLGPGESVLRSEYAVVVSSHGSGIEPKTAGVLYLTNHRVVFEVPVPRGRVRSLVEGRETTTALDAPLLGLRNAAAQRPRLGKPRLSLETERARVAFDVLDPDVWVHAVAGARQALPSPYAPPAPVLHSTHTIERQVVKVRCRFCGSLANEVDPRCPACGAPL